MGTPPSNAESVKSDAANIPVKTGRAGPTVDLPLHSPSEGLHQVGRYPFMSFGSASWRPHRIQRPLSTVNEAEFLL